MHYFIHFRLSFPSIFVTYMAMSGLSICELLLNNTSPGVTIYILSADVTVLIGYLDRYKLYCVSRNLLENIFTPTPYCVIQGNEGYTFRHSGIALLEPATL